MANRPLFKRHHDFTVLRPIRLTRTEMLKPGDTIKSGTYPRHRLMRWYQARQIAQKGSEYAQEFLASKARILKAQAQQHSTLAADTKESEDDNETPSEDDQPKAEKPKKTTAKATKSSPAK